MNLIKWLKKDTAPTVSYELTAKQERAQRKKEFDDEVERTQKLRDEWLLNETERYKIILTTKTGATFEEVVEPYSNVDYRYDYSGNGHQIYFNKTTSRDHAKMKVMNYSNGYGLVPIGDGFVKFDQIDNVVLVKL